VSAAGATLRTPEGGASGGGAGGADADHIYRELMRRLHEEREQLGQSITEPF
jgi:hypothetical protein